MRITSPCIRARPGRSAFFHGGALRQNGACLLLLLRCYTAGPPAAHSTAVRVEVRRGLAHRRDLRADVQSAPHRAARPSPSSVRRLFATALPASLISASTPLSSTSRPAVRRK